VSLNSLFSFSEYIFSVSRANENNDNMIYKALRYKLFFVKALSKLLPNLTIITKQLITIKQSGFMGRIYNYNDYNKTINNETNQF